MEFFPMKVIDEARAKIKGRGLRIVLPEGDDARIAEAAAVLKAEGLAEPLVFSAAVPAPGARHIAAVRARRPGMSDGAARRLLARPLFMAGAMVAAGEAQAMAAGVAHATARVIEAALMTVGLAPGVAVPSSFFLMAWPDRGLIFADCAVNAQPNAGELAAIAVASGRSAAAVLDEAPRVALLSFSTHGSAAHGDVTKVAEAVGLARALAPEVMIDGELQADAALVAAVAAKKVRHESAVAGRANVLVFPDLDAGNISYKLTQHLAGAQAIGPILQGFARPVTDLSRGASVEDIVATATLLLAMA
jgi:phosphate acetyltransferase